MTYEIVQAVYSTWDIYDTVIFSLVILVKPLKVV